MDPMTQNTEAICILVLREYLSAMKDDDNAPTREPNGMAHVMPPCLYDTGFPKYRLYASVPNTPDILLISKPKSPPPLICQSTSQRFFFKKIGNEMENSPMAANEQMKYTLLD
jgi:hypothetical protein